MSLACNMGIKLISPEVWKNQNKFYPLLIMFYFLYNKILCTFFQRKEVLCWYSYHVFLFKKQKILFFPFPLKIQQTANYSNFLYIKKENAKTTLNQKMNRSKSVHYLQNYLTLMCHSRVTVLSPKREKEELHF